MIFETVQCRYRDFVAAGAGVNVSRLALLLVVFIDVMGFGLILPIFTTILLDPSQGFLPADTPRATRQFDYGVVIAVFFLFYFLGAAFIAKISDYIGRKQGIMLAISGLVELRPGQSGWGLGGVSTSRISPSATAKGSPPARRTPRSFMSSKSNIAFNTTSDLPWYSSG